MNLIHIYYVPPLGALLERYGSFGPIVLLPHIAFKGPTPLWVCVRGLRARKTTGPGVSPEAGGI